MKRWFRGTVFFLFFLSGALGLVYEITWMRLFRIVMGNTVYTSSTVLTAFMGGLALGAFLAGRLADRRRRPLRTYGWLEVLVGVYAILLPWLLVPADPVYGWLYRHVAGQGVTLALGRFAISCALLLPPATMMGATLPLLARYLTAGLQWVGRDVGLLYGINTVGAAIGAALAGFILVPAVGVSWTLWAGAAGSLSIGAVALGLDRRRQPAGADTTAPPSSPAPVRPLHVAVIWGLGAAGAASMVYEVAWTRTLTQLIGSSVYAFTLMLVAFIAGLGLGGVLLSRCIDRLRNPVLLLGGLQVVVAFACLAMVPLFGAAPRLVVGLVTRFAHSFAALHTVEFVTLFLLMLVPTFAMGGVFPTVARIYTRDLGGVGRSVGEAYAANTLGSVVGSFAAGFILIPWIGVRQSILLAVLLNAVLGGLFLWLSGWRSARLRAATVGALAVVLLASLPSVPAWNTYLLNSAPYLYAYRYKATSRLRDADLDEVMSGHRRLLYEEEGLTATVTVVASGGQLYLKVNGKTDASSRGDLRSQSLLAHLPALLHPEPRQALLIGLGSGISLGALEDHPVAGIECVELLPEVVRAARLFREANGDALDDPRLHLVVGDGRNHTAHSDRRFDLVISQPSNLWIAGMADLFTVEFFDTARRRLAPGGIMCSWVQAYSMRTDDFRSIVRTFVHVFPHASLWESVPGGDYFLVGSQDPVPLSLRTLRRRAEVRGLQEDLQRIGVYDVEQILSSYVAGEQALRRFAAGAPLNTDDSAVLEFSAPRGLAAGLVGGAGLFGPVDLDPYRVAGPGQVVADPSPSLRAAWQARQAARQALVHLQEGELQQAAAAMAAATAANPADMEVHRFYPELAQTVGADLEAHGQVEAALDLYGAALAAVPEAVSIRLRRARLQARRAELEPALTDFEAAVAADPKRVSAWLDLAVTRARLGRGKAAEAAYEAARAAAPDDPEVYNEWGKYRLRQRRPAAAAAIFTRGLQVAPKDARLANNLGVARAQSGDLEAASRWFQRAVELSPGYVRAHVNLGDAWRALGRIGDATRAYREALRLEPGQRRALAGLRTLP